MTGPARRLGARQLIDTVLDGGSFVSWDAPPLPVAHEGSAYAAGLAAAAEKAGTDESVLTGEGTIRGRRVAVVVGEFAFLAGSIGRAATERIVSAFERATRERLPMLAAPTSGGTRMQEGTPAFVGMVAISAAVAGLKQAGLPYLVYLRHPTTGGVFASWGSQGHVTVAEPGATIGFLGARVYEALYGEPFPEGVQVAENLYDQGIVDAVLPVEGLAEIAHRALAVLDPDGPRTPTGHPPAERTDVAHLPDLPAWESITYSRREDRPGVRTLLRLGATDVLPLRGTGQGEHDPGLMLALARFEGLPCVVLGQDRRGQTLEEPLGPKGLRVARRGMRLAADLGLPLVSVVDTAGAALSKDAEEGGMAGEIARCLEQLVMLPAPTVCVLLGQGTGGGALALLPADRVVCAEHSWLSPLPPEGASAILHRTVDRAPEMAAAQRVRARDLLADGIVDRVVPEHPDAASEPEAFCHRMAAALQEEMAPLLAMDGQERLARRLARYRTMGHGGRVTPEHDRTLASYDEGVAAYLAADGSEPSEAARLVREHLPCGGRVLEIGSGGGRDAAWLRGQGLAVTASDASAGFREHLRSLGLDPIAFDVLTDELPAGEWDALLANAVLLHVPRRDLPGVLRRLRNGVPRGCRFVLSLKTGREDGWSTAKLDAPRWFTYWAEDDVVPLVTDAGWRVDTVERRRGRTDDWLLLDCVAGETRR